MLFTDQIIEDRIDSRFSIDFFFFYFILRAKLRHRFDMDDDTFFCSDACLIYRLTCFNFQQMRRTIFPISNESRA